MVRVQPDGFSLRPREVQDMATSAYVVSDMNSKVFPCAVLKVWSFYKARRQTPRPGARGPGPGPEARGPGPKPGARGPGLGPGARAWGPGPGLGARGAGPGDRAPAMSTHLSLKVDRGQPQNPIYS